MSPNGNNKEIIKAGEVLIVQGQVPKYMYYLHSGAVEILYSPKEFEGLDPVIIASKSKRVGLIKEDMLVLPMNLSFTDPSAKSVRAIQDCSVTRYPVARDTIFQIVHNDSARAISLLSHLYKLLETAVADDSKFTKLYSHICRISDNIALLYQFLPKSPLPEKLSNKSESIYNVFKSNSGNFPEMIEAQFLISDNSAFLRKKYSFPGMPIQSIIDQKQCDQVKKFLNLDKNVFSGLLKEDPSILQNMVETISDNLIRALDRIYAVHNEIDIELETLFGLKSSWSSYLTENDGFDRWLSSGKVNAEFIGNFLTLIKKLHTYYHEISGRKLVDAYPGPKKIHQYYVSVKDGKRSLQEKSAGVTGAGAGLTGRKPGSTGVYNSSMQQIFEFAMIDKELQKGFTKLINDFKNLSNPFNTEPDGRKLRRAITKTYWDIFTQVFIRKQKESMAPPPVKLMMKFGFLDETLIDVNQLEELDEISGINEEMKDIPILFEEEFLKRIYEGRENPSITEMGLTYDAFKREEGKRTNSKDNIGVITDNLDKTKYEIEHRLLQTVGICTGSTSTAFPIMTSLAMKILPKNVFISKSKLRSLVKDLMAVDFSVFYRETTLKLDSARELIEEEVLPIFILLPAFGTKTMLWQDLDGTNRKTRGRIVVPIFFMGDLMKNMAHTFACFRWELNRTIKGGMWADPVEGGLTGIYFDYINFYRKNTKLSEEAKAQVSEKFKSIRTNRDRFADDYVQWLLYEKDGIMRLNAAVREIFYRHIPFKKELRDKLEWIPSFAEIAVKYKNVYTKTMQGYERRYKKYMGKDGTLPEKLQGYMDFLNS
jgi:hypothetical protein